MKKFISILLLFALTIGLVGCGGKQDEDEGQIDLTVSDFLTGLSEDLGGTVDITVSQDALNPLTGEHNMASDRVGLRPYAISVDNADFSGKPQSGISHADIIVEIETEGGISRLMCLFSDTRNIAAVGPVRSLRDQFLELIFPLDPVVVHVGTSVYADKAISENAFRTLDANNVRTAIWERPERSVIAQCLYTSASLILESMLAEGLKEETTSNVETIFNFAAEGETIVPNDGVANTVNYNFSNAYDGDFRYDAETGLYYKWQMGDPHIDEFFNDDEQTEEVQLSFKNLLLLNADISVIPGTEAKGGLITINYEAGGTGYYFTEGHYEQITWTKGVYASNIKLFDSDGNELVMNTGKTHIGIIRNDYADKTVIGE